MDVFYFFFERLEELLFLFYIEIVRNGNFISFMFDISGRLLFIIDYIVSIVNSFFGLNIWFINIGNFIGRSSVYFWGNEDVSMKCCFYYVFLLKF